ncbi:MAG: sulfate reduction electron transfer complex DsrMKJOP subunit DsrM [Acidobacteriota bacterium]|nr:sulfate reduction electron transfer complex DsrMKJOP subunit DsrM [Acidobacteriota bacterium]
MLARNLGLSLLAIVLLALLATGAARTDASLLLVVLPYVALVVFMGGSTYRIVKWARSPVPFRIPTTCGQEKSLPWIKTNPVENPTGTLGVVGRMAQEIFLFRSLFRNTDAKIIGGRTVYDGSKWLWFFGLMFHVSLLIVVLRHLRFFTEPVIPCVGMLSALDGFLETGVPTLYLSDVTLLAGLTFLFLRRLVIPRLRYISLFTDYFALLLIAGIAVTGLLMRHFFPVDLNALKNMTMGWVTFAPVAPENISVIFYIHLCFVFVLMAWLPFSKLMHMGGIFMSPTRNLINNNRRQRHINPWNAPVKVHTYAEYEDEFREKMKAVGLPLEKD